MSSTPVHLLSPPEQGTMQARMNPPSGVRDFGALLQAHEAREEELQDNASAEERQQASLRRRSGESLPAHAGGASSPSPAPVVAPVAEPVDAGKGGDALELVAVPWRLRANQGLSYLAEKAPAAVEPASPRSDSLVTEAAANLQPPRAPRMPADSIGSDRQRHALPGSPLSDAVSEPETPAGPAPTGEATSDDMPTHPASTPWPERLLRWLPDAGQDSSTAWVRDFRIDPSMAQDIVASLQALAKEQGVRLTRIVLNGHPIWHSPSTSRIRPRT